MNKQKFTDEYGNIHYIKRELSRDKQGIIYQTKDADTAIKIMLDNEENFIINKDEIDLFHKKIKRLILKPLPQDIKISRPLALLQNEAGYVVNLLNEMKPFSSFFLNKEYYYTKEHYLNTGGLRRRLFALKQLAITLLQLHSRGLIYFDISENNIYLSDEEHPSIYLVYTDNIEYESSNRKTFCIDNFEIPEIINGEKNTLYSDIYAFGILAYLTLTMVHPFDSKRVDESKKNRWELPWIEDTNDNSSENLKNNLQINLSRTKELNYLFHKLFEEGKEDKYKRPTLPLWIQALEEASIQCLKCLNCQMSYFDNEFENCPYCESKKPKRLIVITYLYKDNKRIKKQWRYIREISDGKTSLPSYLFISCNILESDKPFLEIDFEKNNKITFRFNKNNEKVYFESKILYGYRVKRELESLENGIKIEVIGEISKSIEIKLEN